MSDLGAFGMTWSLAVEWYFYAVWPLVVAWMARRGWQRGLCARWCLRVAGALYAVALTLPGLWFYCGPVARFPELLVGAALAYRLPDPRWASRVLWPLAVAVGVFALVGLEWDSPAYRWFGLPASCALTALVIVVCARGGSARAGLSHLAPLGRVSYSLYLWHYAPMVAVTHLGWHGTIAKVIAVAGVIVTAAVGTALSYRWLEKPHLSGAERNRHQ